jgi:hypothetical protein
LEKEINFYKTSVRNLEKQIGDSKQNEEKLKKENDSIKRQLSLYKEQLKFEMSARKVESKKITVLNNYNNNCNQRKFTPNKNINNKNKSTDNYICLTTLGDDVNSSNPVANPNPKFIRLSSVSSARFEDKMKITDANDDIALTSPDKRIKRRNISAMEIKIRKQITNPSEKKTTHNKNTKSLTIPIPGNKNTLTNNNKSLIDVVNLFSQNFNNELELLQDEEAMLIQMKNHLINDSEKFITNSPFKIKTVKFENTNDIEPDINRTSSTRNYSGTKQKILKNNSRNTHHDVSKKSNTNKIAK